jgi:hypothetical protein
VAEANLPSATLEDLLIIIGDQRVTISLLQAKVRALEVKIAQAEKS